MKFATIILIIIIITGWKRPRMEFTDQEKETIAERKDTSTPLHINYMNRGHYYASSPHRKDLEGAGGWAESENSSRKIQENNKFNKDRLVLLLDTSNRCTWGQRFAGIKTFVVNSSANTIFFSAQDSRLYMKMQAMDKNGEWRDIEYLPSSDCGNSYHQVYLAPGEYWEFSTPLYYGRIKTKLRLQLLYKKSATNNVQEILYSNIIEGSINPGQFWRKQGYSPSGIMDPYWE